MLEGKKLEGVIGFFLLISLALSPHNNMSAKKLINSPDEVVDEVLEGLTMIHPGLRVAGRPPCGSQGTDRPWEGELDIRGRI